MWYGCINTLQVTRLLTFAVHERLAFVLPTTLERFPPRASLPHCTKTAKIYYPTLSFKQKAYYYTFYTTQQPLEKKITQAGKLHYTYLYTLY